jgi:hypothetical protein
MDAVAAGLGVTEYSTAGMAAEEVRELWTGSPTGSKSRRSPMSKKRPSLDAIAGAAAPQRHNVHDVTTLAKRRAAAAPKNRPHTSLYISAALKRALRRTAAELDVKAHDLVLEGIDLVLRKYGKTSIKEIDG